MTRRIAYVAAAVALLLAGVAALTRAQASREAATERWLHVRVEERSGQGELVRVNLPLSVAEKVLPAITADKLHQGRIPLSRIQIKDVDLRAVLEAVRSGAEGEYVNVQSASKGKQVRVARKTDQLIVEARETKDGVEVEMVDVKIPMAVVDAMLSGSSDELDIVAAIRVLRTLGDTELVTVKDKRSVVRIWVDAKNTAE